MVFDADRAREELVNLDRRLAELDAREGSDDEEFFDVMADANELRDILRNHEAFSPLWASLALPPAHARASSKEHCDGCWRVGGVLAPHERAALIAAVGAPQGFRPASDNGCRDDRGGDDGRCRGPIRRSDDLELAQALWPRLEHLPPASLEATVAPAAEAELRQQMWPEFEWSASWRPTGLHTRAVYEHICAAALGLRLDAQESDDRDETDRALMSLVVVVSSCVVVEFEDAPSLEVTAGDAALFRRGDARLAYFLRQRTNDEEAVVVHLKVLYGLLGA